MKIPWPKAKIPWPKAKITWRPRLGPIQFNFTNFRLTSWGWHRKRRH